MLWFVFISCKTLNSLWANKSYKSNIFGTIYQFFLTFLTSLFGLLFLPQFLDLFWFWIYWKIEKRLDLSEKKADIKEIAWSNVFWGQFPSYIRIGVSQCPRFCGSVLFCFDCWKLRAYLFFQKCWESSNQTFRILRIVIFTLKIKKSYSLKPNYKT